MNRNGQHWILLPVQRIVGDIDTDRAPGYPSNLSAIYWRRLDPSPTMLGIGKVTA